MIYEVVHAKKPPLKMSKALENKVAEYDNEAAQQAVSMKESGGAWFPSQNEEGARLDAFSMP